MIAHFKHAILAHAKRTILAFGIIAAIAGLGLYGLRYWTVGRFLVSTDDAYVQADYTTIAPKVPGYIDAVLVGDNQHVRASQILARIDPRDYQTALRQAEANVAAAETDIRNIDAQISLQQAVIAQAAALVASDQAALEFAQQDDRRYRNLLLAGAGTVQRAQQADASEREASAGLQRDRAAFAASQKTVEVLKAQRAKAGTQLAQNRAAEHQATLNLGYTMIAAPITGAVGARSLRVGQYVQAGTQLMAIVPLRSVYVIANFKETQLTDVRKGQPVTIEVDSFPDVVIPGHVDSLAPASGLEFALLPPDNATGNFTKIVQRIPVKIVLDDHRLAGLLRPGMSVDARIDTKSTAPTERNGSAGDKAARVASLGAR